MAKAQTKLERLSNMPVFKKLMWFIDQPSKRMVKGYSTDAVIRAFGPGDWWPTPPGDTAIAFFLLGYQKLEALK